MYLYLSVTSSTVSSVLVRDDQGTQRPVYYVSKVLLDAEKRYSVMEKFALALVTSAKHLRPYFQAHSIIVLTDRPLKQVLTNP